ncbi:MAG: 50S ribosomal protein L24 [Fimbriimonadaceae bacterium]|nr:50S ribosomal protein L24 [Fimbriimonadaceae bacterium]
MPTIAEIKAKKKKIKLKLRSGDKVMIIAGKDKGQVGFIAAVEPEKQKALVLQDNPENPEMPNPLNAVVKHRKAKFQGERSARFKMPSPIHISNLMLVEGDKNTPSRVGRRKEDGKVVRYAKKSGKTIVETKPAKEEK